MRKETPTGTIYYLGEEEEKDSDEWPCRSVFGTRCSDVARVEEHGTERAIRAGVIALPVILR